MLTFEELMKRASTSGAVDLKTIDEAPAVGYNAGKCDVLLGFCSCGACHHVDEITTRRLTPYGRSLANKYFKANNIGISLKEETAPAPARKPRTRKPVTRKMANRRAAIKATKEKIKESKEK